MPWNVTSQGKRRNSCIHKHLRLAQGKSALFFWIIAKCLKSYLVLCSWMMLLDVWSGQCRSYKNPSYVEFLSPLTASTCTGRRHISHKDSLGVCCSPGRFTECRGYPEGAEDPCQLQWTPATTGHGEDIARGAVGTGNWGSGPISAAYSKQHWTHAWTSLHLGLNTCKVGAMLSAMWYGKVFVNDKELLFIKAVTLRRL